MIANYQGLESILQLNHMHIQARICTGNAGI